MLLFKKTIKILFVLVIFTLLNSCGTRDGAPRHYGKSWDEIPNAVPKDEPRSKYGNMANYEVFGKRYYVLDSSNGFAEQGIASWYGTKFHGQRTSSGEKYNMYSMTAAHKTLPLPTYVEVINLDNNRKAIVKVNDRGPFHDGRIIDLSYAAATKLGVSKTGTAKVKIRVVTSGTIMEYSGPGVDDQYIEDDGKIYIQVAAYSTESNAMQEIKKLRKSGFNSVRIHVENNKTKKLYRVRIGPLPTAHVAQKLVVQLKEFEHGNVKIISHN